MRVWLGCFFVLFALAEFFDWLKAFHLPLPIYILGGAFLAIASNYEKFFGSYTSNLQSQVPSAQSQLESLPSSSQPITLTDMEGEKSLAFSGHSEDLYK